MLKICLKSFQNFICKTNLAICKKLENGEKKQQKTFKKSRRNLVAEFPPNVGFLPRPFRFRLEPQNLRLGFRSAQDGRRIGSFPEKNGSVVGRSRAPPFVVVRLKSAKIEADLEFWNRIHNTLFLS
jgi:hypothetical protein